MTTKCPAEEYADDLRKKDRLRKEAWLELKAALEALANYVGEEPLTLHVRAAWIRYHDHDSRGQNG